MVGAGVSSYQQEGNFIAFISSEEPLTPFLVAARAKLFPSTSARRVSLIPLVKLATFNMAAQERWSLAYVGHAVVKNCIKVAR